MKRGLISATVCLAFLVGGAVLSYSTPSGAELFQNCVRCHGEDGMKGKQLKGKTEAQLLTLFHGYRDGSYGGARKETMVGMLKPFSEAELQALAAHIAKL